VFEQLTLFAQRGRNSEINQWLGENPLFLGLIVFSIGSVLALSGVWELKKGVAHDKYGNEIKGGMGRVIAIIRLVFGSGFAIFGLVKIVAGII